MKTISLFTGCGGMDLGAERAGAKVVWANDIMAEAGETYRLNFSEGEFVVGSIYDVTKFPAADLVMGGYPCQSFSMGGKRNPGADDRTYLYMEFARCVAATRPKYFLAENVSGLKSVNSGKWFVDQLELFKSLGYNVSWALLNAADYGVPQKRKRVMLVGVREDLQQWYWFPPATHAPLKVAHKLDLIPHTSHGDAIAGLPLWPAGEFYERPHDPEGHWSWYYMSRNRKAAWDEPSFTIVANFRHVTLHPASPTMSLTWSNLADGWKQRWDFSDEYEHTLRNPDRAVLTEPRRLSWRECALIQSFPATFDVVGKLERKFEQIGNAVPPLLAESVLRPLVDGSGLRPTEPPVGRAPMHEEYEESAAAQLSLEF